jgi:hypothetical protein
MEKIVAFESNSKPSSSSETTQPKPRRPWLQRKAKAVAHGFVSKEFNGTKGFNGHRFRRPHRDHDRTDDPEKHTYLNQFGLEYKKRQDTVTYLSSSTYIPRRLIVQATDRVWKAHPHTRWRRARLGGSVPTALKLSQWALNPIEPKYKYSDEKGELEKVRRGFWGALWGGFLMCLRVLLVCLPLQIYLALPLTEMPWDSDDIESSYLDWPGWSWSWPKFAVNPLDMQPPAAGSMEKTLGFSSKPRLLMPRLLVTKDANDQWTTKDLDTNPDLWRPYVMISYTNLHYHTRDSPEGKAKLEAAAVQVATESGCDAYWMDFKCRAGDEEAELLTSDVNRFCDVIRGAKRVVIALPDNKTETARVWGDRMWTLPEGLLATGDDVFFYYTDMPDWSGPSLESMHKVEMASRVWIDKARAHGEQLQATRQLAEHFSGGVDLSRLQLFSVALHALSDRQESSDKPNDRPELAYALMGLLNNRIDPDPRSETIFQSIARVSLANDTDRLLERMLCLLPQDELVSDDPFVALAQADQFQTHLWDIQPLSNVVGTAEADQSLVVDSARAIPIRWKKFPRLSYRRADGFRKFLAELFVRSGVGWFVGGFTLAWTYAPLLIGMNKSSSDPNSTAADHAITEKWIGYAIMLFFLVGVLLSFVGPACCKHLFGGRVTEMSPHIVGFEGTLPLQELEKIIFGNYAERLDYDPSSTAFSQRRITERRGREPNFVTHPDEFVPLPALSSPEHRLFTIVDTGNLAVSIIQAINPPTVALICGREGGMLRALLCSWDFVSDTLYRETVMRMSSDCLDMARTKSWLKVSLRGSKVGEMTA